jgi:hypothetical protein
MNRLFTFGCSFTEYFWPTWADILGREFDYYQNWGQSGGGNQYIFNSLIEANARKKFTADDTVIVMWTNVTREDRYIDREWKTVGNIYTVQTVYDKEFIKKYADDRGYLIRDLATISATIELLDHWGVKYHMLSMVPLDNLDQHTVVSSPDKDVIELYSSAIKKIKPSIYEVVFNFDWFSKNPNGIKEFDTHPIPSEHLEYIEKVLPEYPISDATRAWVKRFDKSAKRLDKFDFFDQHRPKKRL